MIVTTAIVFIALLLVLVLVHEWGHFYAARKAGCKIEEFGFGFPPRLFSIEKNGTRYSFNLFPLGGFVKIEGENMDEVNPSPTSFASKSAWWRIVILAAGVFMNIVLAIILLTIQAGIGTPTLVTDSNSKQLLDAKTYIIDVASNSPASQAGIQAMDRIVRLNSNDNPTITQIQQTAKEQADQPITVEIERQGKHETLQLTPRQNPPVGQGALGDSLAATGLVKVPWWQAPQAGIQKTWDMTVAIVTQLSQFITQLVSQGKTNGSLTGPIGLVAYTNEVTKMGWSYILEFAALISINLAIFNILPIPALDGGRILFVLLEKVFGKGKLNSIENMSHTIGFALLIGIMILVTIQDIHKYF